MNLLLLAAALVAFLLVIHFGQQRLWRLSLEDYQLGMVEETLAHSDPANLLLLGDSTVGSLRRQGMPPDPGITTIGIGATGSETWRYLLRLAMERGARPPLVVVSSLNASSILGQDAFPPLMPVLMGFGGAYQAWREGQFGFRALLRAWSRALFPITAANEQVLFFLVQPWSQATANTILEVRPDTTGWANPTRMPDPTFPLVSRDRHLEALLGELHAHALPSLFVLSPLSSAKRAELQPSDEEFRELCGRMHLRCGSLRAALPDDAFLEDGSHVKPERRPDFYEGLGRLVRAAEIRGMEGQK